MSEATAKFVNMYNVTSYPNGDVLITARRPSPLRMIFSYGVLALCFYLFVTIEGEFSYMFALIGAVFLFTSVMATVSWFKQNTVFVSREDNTIDVKALRINRTIHADEIKSLRYFHAATHATLTGDIIGHGPKVHIQSVTLYLTDGSDIMLLPLRTGYEGISHSGSEKDDGEELIRIIQNSLRKYVEYVHQEIT
jgi:hypothetical protein